MEDNTKYVSSGLSLTSIGFIVWLVFLILKLCNQGNPNFEWLTWFWVWFPFWLPWAIELLICIIIIPIVIIYIKNSD